MASPIGLIFLAVPCAVVSALTLRPCDVEVDHVVNTDAAVAHSGFLRDAVDSLSGEAVPLPNVNNTELLLIGEFINTIAVHGVARAAQGVQCKLSTMEDVHQQCLLVVAAHDLEMETLMVAIASTKRTWNDIVAMRGLVPVTALQVIVRNVPGIARLHEVAYHDGDDEVVTDLQYRLVTGDDATLSNSARHFTSVGNVLLWAAREGEASVVELLLGAPGIDLHARNNIGRTPLHVAAFYGHVDVVKLLLSSDEVNVNDRDKNNDTPLHVAIQGAYFLFIRFLHQPENIVAVAALDPNYHEVGSVLEPGARSSLYTFVTGGRHGHVIRLLTKAPRINANAYNTLRMTALCWAATAGYAEAVEALLNVNNIKLDTLDLINCTALDQARQHGFVNIEEMLTRHELARS